LVFVASLLSTQH